MDVFFDSSLIIVKLFIWTLSLLFVLFSIIVIRQVQLMTRVLSVPISGGLKFITLGLLVYAILIFIISLVVL